MGQCGNVAHLGSDISQGWCSDETQTAFEDSPRSARSNIGPTSAAVYSLHFHLSLERVDSSLDTVGAICGIGVCSGPLAVSSTIEGILKLTEERPADSYSLGAERHCLQHIRSATYTSINTVMCSSERVNSNWPMNDSLGHSLYFKPGLEQVALA